MKPRTVTEMAIMCATGLIALALVVTALHGAPSGSKSLVAVVVGSVAAIAIFAWTRYLTTQKRAQLDLTGGEQYRQLADEYRRLADLAITAQEHTDLKLGDVSAQLDYLREQHESLQKILKDVE